MRASVVIPAFNEEENIEALHDELVPVIDSLGESEVIYVDDGSVDQTFNLVKKLAARDPRIKVVRLRRNFGQTAALAAGLAVAEGKTIVFMDGDRQNDPADIPKLVTSVEDGFDVASGWRKKRKDKFWTRRLPSQLANRLISRVTGVRLHDYGCTLKAYRSEVIENVSLYGEMHRLIPALVSWVGASVLEVEVNHRPRVAGHSKYGIGRTLKVLLDLVTVKFLSEFSTKPIYLFGGAGMIAYLLAIGAFAYSLYERLASGIYVHRNPVFSIGIFLAMIGTLFILMGVLAELVTRVYHTVERRPGYVIRETVNVRPSDAAAP